MSCASLPAELWLDIASYLESRNDILSLYCLNHAFSELLAPALYSTVRLYFEFPLEDATNTPGYQLLQRIQANSTLHAHIRECNISVGITRDSPGYSECINSLTTLVGGFPHLQQVTFTEMDIPLRSIRHLATLPIGIKLELLECGLGPYKEEMEGMGPTLQSFTSKDTNIEWVLPMLIESPLTHFSCDKWWFEEFCRAHTKLGSPLLVNLTSLVWATMDFKLLSLLRFTPNLKYLKLMIMVMAYDSTPTYIPSDVLPLLETYIGSPCFLPNPIVGRPITSITFHSGGQPPDLFTLGKHLGSTKPIESFSFYGCWDVPNVLPYIAKHNPELQCLRLSSNYPRNLSQSDFTRIYSQEVLKFKQLRELRLIVRPESITDEDIQWEREQCEYMQSNGCPNLIKASISHSLIWKRHLLETVWTYEIYSQPVYIPQKRIWPEPSVEIKTTKPNHQKITHDAEDISFSGCLPLASYGRWFRTTISQCIPHK